MDDRAGPELCNEPLHTHTPAHTLTYTLFPFLSLTHIHSYTHIYTHTYVQKGSLILWIYGHVGQQN